MNANLFSRIDAYIDGLFAPSDSVLQAAEQAMEAATLPPIQVSAGQGKFLYLLAKMIDAQRVLEIGTLGGYSTIWLARALGPRGRLVTLEFDPHHAEVAAATLSKAGLEDQVEIMVGPALDSLPIIEARNQPYFDLIFLDADKLNYVNYLDWSVRLVRPGGLIIADNVIREGAVLDPDVLDESAVGAAQFNTALAAHLDLESIVLQQIGIKGHDGIAIARKRK